MSWSTSVSGTPEEIKAKAEAFKVERAPQAEFRDREFKQIDTVVEAVLAIMTKDGATKASASIYGHAAGHASQQGESMGFSYSRVE